MCTAILFTILSCKHASANQSAPNYQLNSNDAMFSGNLYLPFAYFGGSYASKKASTRLGTALQPPSVWWCSSRDAEVCSSRQSGYASASPPSPMVFLVLEEKVHSLRDVTLLSRHWNINSDANWKWTAFYVLWNEAICNPRIGCKSIWEINQEFSVAVPRQKCHQTPREFEYSGMSKVFEWFGGK